MKRFSRHQHIEVVLIVTNRSEAGVIKRADSFDVETIYLPKSRFENETEILQILLRKRGGLDHLSRLAFTNTSLFGVKVPWSNY